MDASLKLLVCRYYLAEAEAVIRAEGLAEVSAAAYPDLCVHPQADRMAEVRDLFAGAGEPGVTVVLVGACFLMRPGGPLLEEDETHRIHREDLCFHLFAPRELVDHLVRSRAYLVTPGWLADWRRHMEVWGFNQATARACFAESVNRLVLLDTGVDPAAGRNLAECAAHLGLAAERLPVGLDHFRLRLLRIVEAWRAAAAQQRAAAAAAEANRRLADHVLALDLLVKLSRLAGEAEAVAGIENLFRMLFGATAVRYSPLGGDAPAGAGGKVAASDRGFRLRIAGPDGSLAVLEVDVPGFGERRDEYLNLALGIVDLCGLVLTNARTVSRRDRAEAELRVRSAELARSNAELEQFAYIASHDLQAPLRRIVGFGELLRDEVGTALEASAAEYLARMDASARRMQALIEGLLAYSRAGRSTRPFAPVALDAVVRQALDDLVHPIEETGARVVVGKLPEVLGDELQLYQLFLNLLGNALKFTGGGRRPEVRVEARPAGDGRAEVSVRDNGIGFDDKDLDRILQPFQRLHRDEEYPGSGIGLAVCRRIVERHGGQLTARSRPGEGATFLLSLPLAAPVGEDR